MIAVLGHFLEVNCHAKSNLRKEWLSIEGGERRLATIELLQTGRLCSYRFEDVSLILLGKFSMKAALWRDLKF
jgi:hypothetical protein